MREMSPSPNIFRKNYHSSRMYIKTRDNFEFFFFKTVEEALNICFCCCDDGSRRATAPSAAPS